MMYSNQKVVDGAKEAIQNPLAEDDGIKSVVGTRDVQITKGAETYEASTYVIRNEKMAELAGINFAYPVLRISHEGSSLKNSDSYVLAVGESVANLTPNLGGKDSDLTGLELMVGYEALGFIQIPEEIKHETGMSMQEALVSQKTLIQAFDWERQTLFREGNDFGKGEYLIGRAKFFEQIGPYMEGHDIYEPILSQVKKNQRQVMQDRDNYVRKLAGFRDRI